MTGVLVYHYPLPIPAIPTHPRRPNPSFDAIGRQVPVRIVARPTAAVAGFDVIKADAVTRQLSGRAFGAAKTQAREQNSCKTGTDFSQGLTPRQLLGKGFGKLVELVVHGFLLSMDGVE
jgi:hypothetical protein